MQAKVKWAGKSTFLGLSSSGHHIVMDGQGGETAPSPMEMVLLGAGGCSSVDVIAALKAGEQAVLDCEVVLSATRREVAPKLFTEIDFHFVVTGQNLSADLVESAVKESLEKYCSVCLMLGKGVALTHSFEIVEAQKRQ